MGDNGFSDFMKKASSPFRLFAAETFLPTFGNSNASAAKEASTQAPSATEPAASDASELQWARDRISILESTLLLMTHMVEKSQSDSEGHYPALDPACNECTQGATPDKHRGPLCAYHLAKFVMKHSVR